MNYFIANCWGAIYEGGDSALKHKHFPADLAAVCYLEADERSAPIVFGDGRISIQPRSGMLIMFPGVLEHEVPLTEGRRVVVAMNLYKAATLAQDAVQARQTEPA